MKKLLLLTVAFLTVVSLAACQKSPVKLTVQVETDWLPYYEEVKKSVLEDYPNAEITFIETGSFDHLDTLDGTDATNTDVADVYAAPADRMYGLEANDLLAYLPAEEIAANIGGWDNYNAGLGGAFKIDGEYIAIPMNIETLIYFANTANASAAGIDLTKTVEVTDLGYDDMLVAYFNAWYGVAYANAVNLELLGKDTNGNLFSDMTKDWADLTSDQQALFTFLYNYWNFHNDLGNSAWDKDNLWVDMDASFDTATTDDDPLTTSLLLEGPWNTNKYSEIAGDDFDILPISNVTIAGNELAHWKGGWGLVVNARIEEDKDQMELATAFISEIVNPDNAIEFFKVTGKIMENVPASVYENSNVLSPSEKLVVSSVIEGYQNAPARPLFTEWGQVWDTWQNGLLSWNNNEAGVTNPQTAYEAVKASFDAMMSGLK
jgi:arabinogalactan oligomer/maltooligosaccharide transport system substrate-binding protein